MRGFVAAIVDKRKYCIRQFLVNVSGLADSELKSIEEFKLILFCTSRKIVFSVSHPSIHPSIYIESPQIWCHWQQQHFHNVLNVFHDVNETRDYIEYRIEYIVSEMRDYIDFDYINYYPVHYLQHTSPKHTSVLLYSLGKNSNGCVLQRAGTRNFTQIWCMGELWLPGKLPCWWPLGWEPKHISPNLPNICTILWS